LYKVEISLPSAFEVVALGAENLPANVRRRVRERIHNARLLEKAGW
jgi:CRISPR-associated protein Cas1